MSTLTLRNIEDFARKGYSYLTGEPEKRKEFFDFVKLQVENAINQGKTETPGVWLNEIIAVVEKTPTLIKIPEESSVEALKWVAENLVLVKEAARVAKTGLGRKAPLYILTKYLPEIYRRNFWSPTTYSTPLDVLILIYETLRFKEKYGKSDDGSPTEKTIKLAKEAVYNWRFTTIAEKAGILKIEEREGDKTIREVISEWVNGALKKYIEDKTYEALAFAMMIDGTELVIMSGVKFDDEHFSNALSEAVSRNVREKGEIIASELETAIKRKLYGAFPSAAG